MSVELTDRINGLSKICERQSERIEELKKKIGERDDTIKWLKWLKEQIERLERRKP